ncbi:hypothetical protein JCM16303_005536 [Sporobolomyces ruberrimus]
MIANRDPPYAQRLSTKKEMVEPKQQATIREAAEAANMRRITSLGTAQREALAAAAEAKRREVNLEFKLDLERASLKVARKGFERQRARTAQDHKAQLARLADASRQSQLEKENLQEELKELKDALARVKKECERSKEECESSKEATQGHQEECEQLRNDLVNARNESDSVRTELENTQRGLEQAKQELEQSKREIAQMTGERACSPEHDEETRSEASIDSALEPLFGTSPALSRKLIEVMEEFGEFPFFPLCTA